MARCSSPSCECNSCPNCGEYRNMCRCSQNELREDTQRLLNQNDYTYEDFAHSARYLLQRWVNNAG